MSRELNVYERDILIGALPTLLKCKIEPFPFKELTKFFKKNDWKDEKGIDKNMIYEIQAKSFSQPLKNK